MLISLDKATLAELDTVYSTEDVYLMLEVLLVDAHNRRLTDEYHAKRDK